MLVACVRNRQVLVKQMRNECQYMYQVPLDNVVNLSDTPLTEIEKKVLSNGLKFCPTPGEPHMGDVRRDLDKFHRSLHHFGKLDPDNQKEEEPSIGLSETPRN